MFKKIRKNKKAQNTAEYAILISLVVAAIIAMQVYVQRGLQGRIRDAVKGYLVDQTNPQGVVGLGRTAQYEPYYLSSSYNVVRTEETGQILRPGTLNAITASADSTRDRPVGFQESTFCLQTDETGDR